MTKRKGSVSGAPSTLTDDLRRLMGYRRSRYMDAPEDIAWAVSVHGVPAETLALVLYGNEDCPDRIECYREAQPLVTDTPFAVFQDGKRIGGVK
jgi:hypothetical protein